MHAEPSHASSRQRCQYITTVAGGGGGGGKGVVTAGTGELLGVGDVPIATFTEVGGAAGTGVGSGLALGGTGGPVALGGVPAVGNGETGGGGGLGGHLALLRLVMAARHRHTSSAPKLQYHHASSATRLALGGVGGSVVLGSVSAVGIGETGGGGGLASSRLVMAARQRKFASVLAKGHCSPCDMPIYFQAYCCVLARQMSRLATGDMQAAALSAGQCKTAE